MNVDILDVVRWFVFLTVGVGSTVALLHYSIIALSGINRGGLRRREPEQPLRYIFMVPSLNEELVIGATIERLLQYPEKPEIWVIDDGSDDATPEIVRAYAAQTSRVRHVRRDLPNARQGKGEGLNDCYRRIVAECERNGDDPNRVIVAVMDADGLLDSNALRAVDGLFGNPEIGGVQVAVRILNRETWQGRIQDADFFVFGSILQTGRNRLGSVGLGGNGQFTRLAALMSIGERPWTDCLTEDLDLGLQLIVRGWRLAFTNRTAVHQQGLVEIDKLVRQRTRWIQGQFQCWARIPEVIQMKGAWYTRFDLVYHLVWAALTSLIFPFAVLLSWGLLGFAVTTQADSFAQAIGALALAYGVGLLPGFMIALYYRKSSGDISMPQAWVLAHVMILYQFVWFVAGWRAIGRIATGRNGWAKTARIAPAPAG